MTIDISFSIVGIANIIVDVEVLNHLYLTAPGKDVILRREPQNIVDIRAVEVLLDGKKIGYVRAHDVREYGLDHLLEHERGYSAKIIAKHPDYASFNALMQVNNAYLKPENNDSLEYAHWSYTGYTVDGTCVDEWNDLQNVMDSMHTLLDQGTANADNMQPLMDKYVMLAEYGFSSDFFEDRKQLYKKICDYKDEDVRSLSREMVSVSAYIHNPSLMPSRFFKNFRPFFCL